MLEKILARALRGFRKAPTKGYWNLSPKRGNKNYYKGKGSIATGRHTRKGGYLILQHKLPRYIVPDLTGFQLKPYISISTPKINNKEALSLIAQKKISEAISFVKAANIKNLSEIDNLIGKRSKEEIEKLKEAANVIVKADKEDLDKVKTKIQIGQYLKEIEKKDKITEEVSSEIKDKSTSETKSDR